MAGGLTELNLNTELPGMSWKAVQMFWYWVKDTIHIITNASPLDQGRLYNKRSCKTLQLLYISINLPPYFCELLYQSHGHCFIFQVYNNCFTSFNRFCIFCN